MSAVSSLHFPLCSSFTLTSHISFFYFAGPKGPPFGNAQRCSPLSTKHMKTEGSWKNMRNMRRDMRARWRWRTFKEAALDVERDDRLEIGRISHIHTPQCPAATGSAGIWSLAASWRQLWTTCDAVGRMLIMRERAPKPSANCIFFLLVRLDWHVFAATSHETTPLHWTLCGDAERYDIHHHTVLLFVGVNFFFPPAEPLCVEEWSL